MKKITPVFGPQELFNGASEFVEVIRFNDYSREYLWGDLNTIQLLTFEELKAIPIVAMRHIIAEPKRWTVEDQKAGRMPEVDCVVRTTGMNEDARIAAINNDSVCVVFEDGAFVTLHVSSIAPIEAPEEKAQREEDEFVDSLGSVDIPCGGFFNQGARAAYRKLKCGE